MGREASVHKCCDRQKLTRGLWSPDEDTRLIAHIQKHGAKCWSRVPSLAGLQRCGKSCRLRWINYLRPDIKRGKVTADEESLIIKLHAVYGNRWSTIAAHLPGRTDNEIKNFWNSFAKPKNHQTRKEQLHRSSEKNETKDKIASPIFPFSQDTNVESLNDDSPVPLPSVYSELDTRRSMLSEEYGCNARDADFQSLSNTLTIFPDHGHSYAQDSSSIVLDFQQQSSHLVEERELGGVGATLFSSYDDYTDRELLNSQHSDEMAYEYVTPDSNSVNIAEDSRTSSLSTSTDLQHGDIYYSSQRCTGIISTTHSHCNQYGSIPYNIQYQPF